MSLRSMTGFARHQSEDGSFAWELRSVNGKGLDVRLRLPTGSDGLEPLARDLCRKTLGRGNVQVALTIERPAGGPKLQLNEDHLSTVLDALAKIDARADTRPSSAAEILSLRGILEPSEEEGSDEKAQERNKTWLKGLEAALAALQEHRGKEGRALEAVFEVQLNTIEALRLRAEADPSHQPNALFEKLSAQVNAMLESGADMDPQRLHQEAAILATKADVREELDRLAAHVVAARELIAGGSPVGRKLEFLAQEFNREANTLCSKSSSTALTAIGLELKVVIDQFREQVLNVE
ncbi:MAG: YicC/YloC family endoribonuclease [Pseudomonadota bacterium]